MACIDGIKKYQVTRLVHGCIDGITKYQVTRLVHGMY